MGGRLAVIEATDPGGVVTEGAGSKAVGRTFRPGSGTVGLVLLGMAWGAPLAGQETPSRRISLEEAVGMALRVAPAAVQSETDLTLAEAERLESLGSWLPTLSMNSGYSNSSNERFDQATGRLVTENYTAQAQMGMDLFTGGRRIFQRRSVAARMDAAIENQRDQRFQVILATTQIYLEAAGSDELVRSAAQRLERAREQLRFAESRLEVGTATRSDQLRAELEMGNAELALVDAESSLRSIRLQLGRQVGLQQEILPLENVLPLVPPALPELEVVIARAEAVSPSVLAARAALVDRQAARWTSRSPYLPTLRLTGQYDWFAFEFPPTEPSWNLRLTASVPVLNGFQREANLARSRAQEEVADARFRDVVIGVRVAAEDSYREIASAARRVSISERGVELAREDLRVQEDRYRIGAATILELQTSQVAVTDAETAWVRERQALGIAVARLEAILGETLSGEIR
jgi:outer membrane protein